MKLRIKGDSLRLRITRPELATLVREQIVEETIHFGLGHDQRLTYRLQIGGDRIRATYELGTICIWVPDERVREWSEPGQVSLGATQVLADSKSLAILVEKDFICLDAATAEQDPDAFPNLAGVSCK